MILREPVGLIGLARTAIGRLGGMNADLDAWQLQAAAFKAVAGAVPSTTPDDVIVGNVRNSIGNLARVAALEAGVPESVPAMTIDRQCASSLEALVLAAAKIGAGMARHILVGGVESASRAPWLYEKSSKPYAYFEPKAYRIRMAHEASGDPPMGETAELLADEFAITRAEMDAFALMSHQRAAAARQRGETAGELIAGETKLDECVRADSTLESLAKLRPVFRKDGRVTAGSSSPLNDAAAACHVASREQMALWDIEPAAWLTGVETVGCDPRRMGLGPALAIPRLLERHGLTIADVDLFEINEAFAAQVLAVLKHLDRAGWAIPADKLNVNGGAIALGHPLGATGLRLVVTLVHALRARGLRRGVASLCVGGGQGMAVLVETGFEE